MKIVGVANAQDRPKSKYRNVKTAGHASKKEAKRAQELRLLEKAGKIRNLREQVRYELIGAFEKGQRPICYIADFVYEEPMDGKPLAPWLEVVEDCKGYRTPVYKIKKRLMQREYGIRILET